MLQILRVFRANWRNLSSRSSKNRACYAKRTRTVGWNTEVKKGQKGGYTSHKLRAGAERSSAVSMDSINARSQSFALRQPG